jgi:uncharacterized membrane protein YgcG
MAEANSGKTDKKKFNWRGTMSLLAAASFVVMTVTGIVLYAAPQGRVARWEDWRVAGLDKEQWGAVHTTSSLLFMVAACVHLYFNWRVFLHYIRVARQFNLKREMIATLLITAVVVAGTVWEVPPFSNIMAANTRIKAYWEARSARAPYPHAEASTLVEFAQQTRTDLEQLKTRLTEMGVDVDEATTTIGSAAEELGLSPGELFERLGMSGGGGRGGGGGGRGGGGRGTGGGGGFGRQTLAEVCRASGVDAQQAIAMLKAEGVQAGADETLRDIADRAGVRPPDIAEMIRATADAGGSLAAPPE